MTNAKIEDLLPPDTVSMNQLFPGELLSASTQQIAQERCRDKVGTIYQALDG